MNGRTLWKRVRTIASWTFISRILGLVRDRLMGAFFGASLILDAFYVAFALPNMFRNLFGEGALSSAFIPRYAQLRERDPLAAEAFAGLVLSRLTALLSIIAAIGMIVTGLLMFYGTHQKTVLVALLAFAQLPYLVFICVSAIMAGVLHTRHHFAIPAAAPIILNICMIACIVWWQDIYFLPYAIFTAGVFQLFIHILALKQTGGVPKCQWSGSTELTDMRKAMMPTLIASSVYQFNAFLDAIIAYEFLEDATGAVVVLYFGNRLLQFPLALIAHGVGTAAYPELSRAATQGYVASGTILCNANRLLLALVIPAAVGLFLVAEPLTRLVYQAGSFGNESVLRVAAVTQLFALGLVPIALGKLFVRTVHAHRDQRNPMFIAIGGVFINLGLNIYFVLGTELQERGLALASVISSTVICLIYIILLLRRGVQSVFPWRAVLGILTASIIMGGCVYGLTSLWRIENDANVMDQAFRLLSLVLTGAAVYAVIMLSSLKRWRKTVADNT